MRRDINFDGDFEQMRLDRNFWFGQAHLNYADCRHKFGFLEVRAFINRLKEQLCEEDQLLCDELFRQFYSDLL